MPDERPIGLPEGTEPDFVVCRRIAGRHILPGEDNWLRRVCSQCAHPIWLNPQSPTKYPLICDECCADMVIKERDAGKGDEVHFCARTERALEQGKQVVDALTYWRRKNTLS